MGLLELGVGVGRYFIKFLALPWESPTGSKEQFNTWAER